MKTPTLLGLALAVLSAPAAAQSEDPKKPEVIPATPLVKPGEAAAPQAGATGIRAIPVISPGSQAAPGVGQAVAAGKYEALASEYAQAYAAWRSKVMELRGTGEEYPERPEASYYLRFRGLADTGDVDARLWCMQYFQYDATPEEFRAAAWKGEAYSLATALRDDEKACSQLVQSLGGGLAVEGVGEEGIAAVYAYIDGTTSVDAVRANLLASRARNAEWSRDPEQRKLAAGIYEELIAKYPDSDQAQRAIGKVFAAKNLQIGQTPPDFTGNDVDGNPISLSDYRGRVVLLDFWGFW